MYGFIRIAAAVPHTDVASVDNNTTRIISMISEAGEGGADIAVFPELAVTSYSCADLFFQDTLITAAADALARIASATVNVTCAVLVGCPLRIRGALYNCGVLLHGGKIIGVVPKTYIPNYNEFYEKRWFSSAADLPVKELRPSEMGIFSADDSPVPVGNDLLFDYAGEVTFSIDVCEDLWAPLPPSTLMSLAGAELTLNLSASNETIEKRAYRRSLVSSHSAACISAYAYVSAGYGESTTDLIFSGHSIIAENGSVISENEKYIDSGYLLMNDVDIGRIRADRAEQKTFGDCAAVNGAPSRARRIPFGTSCGSDGTLREVRRLPFVPDDRHSRTEKCMNIFEMQVTALAKRLSVTGGGAVIGVSGGLDSTLAILVAAQAMRRMGRSPSEVIGVTMPCFGTTDRTYENALTLMRTIGVTERTVPIKEACMKHFEDIGHDPSIHDVTYENVQARERTQVLMDIANKTGGIVVGTGDLSELALGWCTYNADHMSMYGVNSGVPKTLVRWMVESIMESGVFPDSVPVLKDVLDTPVSPELLPPDEHGNIVQRTEDLVGPYALHDFFLYYVVRFGFSPKKINFLANRAFEGVFSSDEILKWQKNFYRRFFTQQFKRSCLPDGVKVGSICLSPRGDWRMPSDAVSKLWLDELETI
jgi:NAD+ synthase (glutamine-hydrolysing)